MSGLLSEVSPIRRHGRMEIAAADAVALTRSRTSPPAADPDALRAPHASLPAVKPGGEHGAGCAVNGLFHRAATDATRHRVRLEHVAEFRAGHAKRCGHGATFLGSSSEFSSLRLALVRMVSVDFEPNLLTPFKRRLALTGSGVALTTFTMISPAFSSRAAEA